MLRIFVGYDQREVAAYQVCVRSLIKHASAPLKIEPLLEPHLRALGIYTRPQERRFHLQWDTISDRPMSTEFAVARFAVPMLCRNGWVLWCDCDFLWRADVAALFDFITDPRFAVMVVKHARHPLTSSKMDGQTQVAYPRKWWSSLILWNTSHPSNAALTPELLNTAHRDELHGFGWLKDEEIGELPPEWNYLVGLSHGDEVKAAHFTLGAPNLPGFKDVPYADEWRERLAEVAA